MNKMLEQIEFSKLQTRLGSGHVQDQHELWLRRLRFWERLLEQLDQHVGEVDEIHQQPLLLPQVGEVILGQGDGEVEEVVPGVRDDDGHAPGLSRC